MNIISVQRKALKGHSSILKHKLIYALKGPNDENMSKKEDKYQVLDLQERMDKKY